MEYTKDVILGIRYDEVHNAIRADGKKRTSRLLQVIRRHKIMTTAVLSAIVFISVDVVLVTSFFRILTSL